MWASPAAAAAAAATSATAGAALALSRPFRGGGATCPPGPARAGIPLGRPLHGFGARDSRGASGGSCHLGQKGTSEGGSAQLPRRAPLRRHHPAPLSVSVRAAVLGGGNTSLALCSFSRPASGGAFSRLRVPPADQSGAVERATEGWEHRVRTPRTLRCRALT